jgi:hypothetical protein
MILRGRLSGSQRMRLGGLLDMLYKPSELAQEIDFSVRQVYRVYIPLGCPCDRVSGRVWINGKMFAEWYETTYPRQTLKENEAFCLTCKKAVSMLDAKRKNKGRLHYWVCNCPHCGRKISRILDKEKRSK